MVTEKEKMNWRDFPILERTEKHKMTPVATPFSSETIDKLTEKEKQRWRATSDSAGWREDRSRALRDPKDNLGGFGSKRYLDMQTRPLTREGEEAIIKFAESNKGIMHQSDQNSETATKSSTETTDLSRNLG